MIRIKIAAPFNNIVPDNNTIEHNHFTKKRFERLPIINLLFTAYTV